MKRPIAMKCTQEQFDSIKDRLKNIQDLDSSAPFIYLINDFDPSDIPSVGYYTAMDHHEIHETFNADIFLEACGVDVEKVWRSEEMQTLSINGTWIDCIGGRDFRFKPQPNYQKEIEALQQKAKENGQSVTIVFEKL